MNSLANTNLGCSWLDNRFDEVVNWFMSLSYFSRIEIIGWVLVAGFLIYILLVKEKGEE